MSKEICPGLNICEEDLKKIKHAFDMETIISTEAESMKDGWNAFRENEEKLQNVGITVKKGQGRCSNCPIATFR